MITDKLEAIKRLHENLLATEDKRLAYCMWFNPDTKAFCTACTVLSAEQREQIKGSDFQGTTAMGLLCSTLNQGIIAQLCRVNNALGDGELETERYTRVLAWAEEQITAQVA